MNTLKLAILLILFAAACTKSDPPPAIPIPTPTPAPTPAPIKHDTVSFKKNVLPVFAGNCVNNGCHGSGGQSPILTAALAYSQLLNLGDVNPYDTAASASKLYQRLSNTTNPHPPSGKLPAAKIDTVAWWIREGCKDN